MDNRRSFIPNLEAPLPPLPDSLPPTPEPPLPDPMPDPDPFGYRRAIPYPEPYRSWWPPFRFRSLRSGCYLTKLTSSFNPLAVADGTLRVEAHANGRTPSGDLYQRRIFYYCVPSIRGGRSCTPVLAPDPKPTRIPIFPRSSYRYYLRVTQILEWLTFSNSFTLGVDLYRFSSSTKTWRNEGAYTAKMVWTTAPAGYSSSGDYLEGDVKNSAGTVVGRLTMGWVSEYLRRATVEIDRVSASEAPLNSGTGVDWRSIFDEVGWDINVVESDANVTEPSGQSWSLAELHQGMLDWRDSANLDTEWRYHLLCVRRLDDTSRGIMYDAYGSDANSVPREGAAISSHWQFTNDPFFPEAGNWGACAPLRFGQCTRAYFRTGVHEIGHAIMMFHPSGTAGNHIMQVTPQIASNALPPVQFPDNIDWSFSPEDQRRLRHLPDVVVRPGSILRFGSDVGSSYAGVPLSPLDVTTEIEGLEVQVRPLLDAVPLGAPVRVDFCLVNKGPEPLPVPARLSLKAGNVAGEVIDPSGTARTFSTIIRYLDQEDTQILEPKQSLGDSLTLLRGPDGALFASPGLHRVVVAVTWDTGGCPVRISGQTSVMVTPPVDEEHAAAALKVLATPDALVTLVVGGDRLPDGVEAIQAALDNRVLKPHFAYIEAKRLAQRFGKRKANLKEAANLITDETVMSPAEIKKAAKLAQVEKSDSAVRKSVAKMLKSKAKELDVSDEVKAAVDSL